MKTNKINLQNTPNTDGYFGDYGGQIIPPQLKPVFDEIAVKYEEIKNDHDFLAEYNNLLSNYAGRPSPLYFAKRMGKKKLLAETGAGQHGVALATTAAIVGIECEIHRGMIDIEKQHPNVVRMKLLGTKIVEVSTG